MSVYLRELVIVTLTFHIVAINNYKSIKSIDNNLYKKITNAKSKKLTSCPPVILLKINEYGITATTMITKSKTD